MNVNKSIDEHLNGDEVVRYNLLVPGVGITVQFCVTDGKVYMYGSVSYSTPNSALNDFMLVFNCSSRYDNENCSCGEEFIGEETWSGKKKVRREAVTTELYITIEGDMGSSRNAFVLNVTEGDVPTDCVGELIASDCGDNTSTHRITSKPKGGEYQQTHLSPQIHMYLQSHHQRRRQSSLQQQSVAQDSSSSATFSS